MAWEARRSSDSTPAFSTPTSPIALVTALMNGSCFTRAVRHLLALGLVFGVQREPVLRAAKVEKHQDRRRLLLICQPPERLDPPVDGVRRKAVSARELRHREETAVGDVETVDKQPFGHERSQTRFFAAVNRNHRSVAFKPGM